MTSKHTPGPWIPVAVEGGWDGVAENENRNSVICALRLNNPANARLIASAPEMLSSLISSRAVLARALMAAAPDLFGTDEEVNEHLCIQRMDAAIAKATGQ